MCYCVFIILAVNFLKYKLSFYFVFKRLFGTETSRKFSCKLSVPIQ